MLNGVPCAPVGPTMALLQLNVENRHTRTKVHARSIANCWGVQDTAKRVIKVGFTDEHDRPARHAQSATNRRVFVCYAPPLRRLFIVFLPLEAL